MTSKLKSPVTRYVIAALCVAAAVGATIAVRTFFSLNPTPLILIGVVAASWYCGRWPGLLSVVLADVAIDFFFEDPLYHLDFAPVHLVRLLVLTVISILASSRKKAELKLADRERQQAAVAKFGQDALSSLPAEELLVKAADLARDVLDVEFCAVCELSGDENALKASAGSGWDEDIIGFEFGIDSRTSLAGHVLASGEPIMIANLENETRYQYSDLLRRHRVRGSLGVPILQRERPFGVLGAFSTRRRDFTSDECNFLRSIANIIAEATLRLEFETAIEEQRTWLHTTLSSIGDGVIATDADGAVSLMNPVAEKMTGWTQAEALRRPLEEVFCIVNEDTRLPVTNPVKQVFSTGAVVGLANHTILISKDGSELPIIDSAAPIIDGGEVSGVVLVFSDVSERKEAERARRESEIMQRLVEAQESERHRIARDLHDHLGQRMTALRLKIESLKRDFSDHPELEMQIAEARRAAIQIDRDIGFLSWELRPTELEDLGLENALGSFVREWSDQYGVTADFHANLSAGDLEERLSKTIETNLYRILQEGLNNIIKHADAQKVSVLLQERNDHIVLTIEDDGHGFDSEKQDSRNGSTSGLGLVGMRERAALLKGTLEVETSVGAGTTVLVRIPVPAAEEHSAPSTQAVV